MTAVEAVTASTVAEVLDQWRRRPAHLQVAAEVYLDKAVAAGADPDNPDVIYAVALQAQLNVPRPVLELPDMDPRLSLLVGSAVEFFVDHE